MKLSFPAIIADKQREFSRVSQSGLDWTVVRLPAIELTDQTGPVHVSLTDCPGKKISAADLALFLVGQLKDEQYIGQTPFLAN